MIKGYQTFVTFIVILGVPIFIFFKYTWWLGLLSFILGILLNSGVGWFLVLKTDLASKKCTPYIKMIIISFFLIFLAHFLSH